MCHSLVVSSISSRASTTFRAAPSCPPVAAKTAQAHRHHRPSPMMARVLITRRALALPTAAAPSLARAAPSSSPSSVASSSFSKRGGGGGGGGGWSIHWGRGGVARRFPPMGSRAPRWAAAVEESSSLSSSYRQREVRAPSSLDPSSSTSSPSSEEEPSSSAAGETDPTAPAAPAAPAAPPEEEEEENDEDKITPKAPHVDGRKQFADVPDGRADTPVERLVSDADVQRFRDSIRGQLLLAPLTKGGNLPFRRLCVDFGCTVTVSEMVFARFLLKRNPVEKARLRRHHSEKLFGVQIATNQISEGVNAGRLAYEAGADFIDLNCGCPIHETWKRGLGAALLKKPAKLERLVRGIADGVPLPLTVKIRLGAGSSEAPAQALAEACERGGAAAVIIHGRTKEQRYTRAANWTTIGEIQRARGIPVVGNGDILTWYEHKRRMDVSGASAAMVGRGALIKPWIFKEVKEGKDWNPTPEERIEVYLRLCGYFKDHFQADELGRKRYMEFMPWHFGFFCRYRPLPEAIYGAMAEDHPLLQTRLSIVSAADEVAPEHLPRLERLLRCEIVEAHERMSAALWEAEGSVVAAVAALEAMAGDGALERWEAEEAEEKSRGREDQGMGGGDTIRG